MKKFFSLMLVALLLVSAIPFQAFAAGDIPVTLIFEAVDGSETRSTYTASGLADQEYMISGIATYVNSGWESHFGAGGTIKAYDVHGTSFKGSGNASVDVTNATEIFIRIKENTCNHASTTKTSTANCVDAGIEKVVCNDCGKTISEKAVASGGHSYGDYVTTTAATCKATGVETKTCSKCGDTQTRVIPKLTTHEFDANTNKCEVCGLQRYIVRFVSEYEAEQVRVVYSGEAIDVPSATEVLNHEFRGWYNNSNFIPAGRDISDGDIWTAGVDSDVYYACYGEGDDDDVSQLFLYVRRYVDGNGKNYHDELLINGKEFKDGDSIYDWLYENKKGTIASMVYAKYDYEDYQWNDTTFYKHSGDEVWLTQDLKADGDKYVLIKLDSTKANTANVQLYLHSSSDAENPFRILDMDGYSKGDYINRTMVANKVKEYYSYKNIGNLFTDAQWTQLMNGENPSGSTGLTVDTNGNYKIHVVVTNASTKSSAKADSTNPKTGDYITIAAGAMVMSAAAFITLAELKKRKMI